MTALAAVAPLPLRAVAYCRISADLTGEAQGVERQEQACRDLAAREGWDVVEVVTDNDVSAYSGVARPGYERLLTLMERGQIDAVVAYHSDRLYRRPRDLERLVDVIERAEVRVLTAMSGAVDLSTASGRMVAKMLAVVSEHESARIGERVSAKHKQNARQGKAHGGIRPFGYDRVEGKPGELRVNAAEAELIREAAARILAGGSLNGIVINWNERGIPTVHGHAWRPNSLSKVLRSARIAGLREAVDPDERKTSKTAAPQIVGPGNWEAILDRATWERVRSRIIHAPIGRRPRVNLLAGMVVCGTCGARMRCESGGNDRYRGRQYSCDRAGKNGCGSCSAKAEKVEEIVVAHVLAALEGVNLAQERARSTVEASAGLARSIGADEEMLTDLAADYGARRIGRAQWLAATAEVEARLGESRRALEQVDADSRLDSTAFDGLDAGRWVELDLDAKRAVIRLFVDRIVIAKGGPGRTFRPERVTIVPAAVRPRR